MTYRLASYRAAGQIGEAAETNSEVDLAPIVQMLGGCYALMFQMSVADDRVEHAACHGVDTGYVSRLVEAGRERLLPGWLSQLESGSVVDRAAFGSDQQFARTDFYNHVIRPEGSFHCMIATPCRSRFRRLHLVIGRPRHQPGFDAEDMRLLRHMLPLVRDLVEARAEVTRSGAAARSAFGISEAWDDPVLVTDAGGFVQYANRGARRLLATCGTLVVGEDLRLKSNTPSNDRVLRQAIAAALKTGRREVANLQAPGDAKGLRLSVRTADAQAPDTQHRPAWVVITAETDGSELTDGRLASLRQHHGLTQRETTLLFHLVQGTHLKGACRQLGISYNTGRSHLRQIFGKTQTNRQSDLMRLWAASQPR